MVHVAGSVLDPDLGDHVCLPFDGERERMTVTRVFTVNGLRRRVKVVIMTHTDTPERTRTWLAPLVPGFAEAESAGRIEILACADTHFTDGLLDPARLRTGLAAARDRAGGHGVYALVDASWGLGDAPGHAAFEAAVNELFGEGWLAAVCQYDRGVFPRDALEEAAAVHPISPEQALLRFARAGSGLRVWGDVDLTNRPAFASLLRPLVRQPGEVVIDAGGLGFIDAGSAQLLATTAMARPRGTTTVICRAPMARVLRLIGADQHLAVRRADDD